MKTKRINISLDARLHEAAVRLAESEMVNGGFSGYVADLIKADLKKARAGKPAGHTGSPVNLLVAVEEAEAKLLRHANRNRKAVH